MEVKLDKLIEKIKIEGVQEAKSGAEKIVAQAKEEAAAIIKKAEDKSKTIIKEAEDKSDQYRDTSKVAIEQAARDVIISLKESIIAVFDGLLKRDIAESLKAEVVKNMIINIVSNWSPDKDDSIEVLMSKKDRDSLKDFLLTEFKNKIKVGFDIKIHPGLEHGFRIGIEGEDSHYDFSDKGIADAVGLFLNKEIREIIDKSLNG